MNKKVRLAVTAAAVLALCGVCAAAMSVYTRSKKEKFYDLSVDWEGGAMPDDNDYERNGWSAYTCEGAEDALTPDGAVGFSGGMSFMTLDGADGFTGLTYPGQTVYFARVMEEDVDSPLLVLDTGNCSVAVFLAETMLYTDCPEQDKGRGYLQLPMLEKEREEPVLVKLPRNYRGKILTIAQSTDPLLDADTAAIRPCDAALYCSYAYEAD